VSNIGEGVLAGHALLDEWGRWCRSHPGAWPKRTVMGRIIEEGPGSGGSGGIKPTVIPERVLVLDRVVAQLPRSPRAVVRNYYLIGGRDEDCAKRMRMAISRFKRLLRGGRLAVAGELGLENINFTSRVKQPNIANIKICARAK
jgi:hypothetical protein